MIASRVTRLRARCERTRVLCVRGARRRSCCWPLTPSWPRRQPAASAGRPGPAVAPAAPRTGRPVDPRRRSPAPGRWASRPLVRPGLGPPPTPTQGDTAGSTWRRRPAPGAGGGARPGVLRRPGGGPRGGLGGLRARGAPPLRTTYEPVRARCARATGAGGPGGGRLEPGTRHCAARLPALGAAQSARPTWTRCPCCRRGCSAPGPALPVLGRCLARPAAARRGAAAASVRRLSHRPRAAPSTTAASVIPAGSSAAPSSMRRTAASTTPCSSMAASRGCACPSVAERLTDHARRGLRARRGSSPGRAGPVRSPRSPRRRGAAGHRPGRAGRRT